MSDVIRHVGGAEIVRLDDGRAMVTGTTGQVGAALEGLRRRGLLAAAGEPKPLGDGRVVLTCRLLPAVRYAPQPRQRLSSPARVGVAGAVLAVLGGLGWLAYQLLEVVIHNAYAVIGGLLLLALLLGGVGRACVTHITIRHHH